MFSNTKFSCSGHRLVDAQKTARPRFAPVVHHHPPPKHQNLAKRFKPARGLANHCPYDFFAITCLPIEWFCPTCINLFPESFMCGVQDPSVHHGHSKFFGDGNYRRTGTKESGVLQDVHGSGELSLILMTISISFLT